MMDDQKRWEDMDVSEIMAYCIGDLGLKTERVEEMCRVLSEEELKKLFSDVADEWTERVRHSGKEDELDRIIARAGIMARISSEVKAHKRRKKYGTSNPFGHQRKNLVR